MKPIAAMWQVFWTNVLVFKCLDYIYLRENLLTTEGKLLGIYVSKTSLR